MKAWFLQKLRSDPLGRRVSGGGKDHKRLCVDSRQWPQPAEPQGDQVSTLATNPRNGGRRINWTPALTTALGPRASVHGLQGHLCVCSEPGDGGRTDPCAAWEPTQPPGACGRPGPASSEPDSVCLGKSASSFLLVGCLDEYSTETLPLL